MPGERTKSEADDAVPLTDAAIALLPEPGRPDAPVFPSAKRGQPLSDATMLKALRTLRKDDATVHVLRASFRTWAAEATNCPREIAEAALGHRVGDDVERAYPRRPVLRQALRVDEGVADYVSGA